jgi:hypothetical protein
MERSLVAKIQWFADKIYLRKLSIEDDLIIRTHYLKHDVESKNVGRVEAYDDVIMLMEEVFDEFIMMDYDK